MGHLTSRLQPTPTPPHPDPIHSTPPTLTTRRSRTRSMRRSILNLVTPSPPSNYRLALTRNLGSASGDHSRPSSAGSSFSPRKRWRRLSKRRRSIEPVDAQPPQVALPVQEQSIPAVQEEPLATSSQDKERSVDQDPLSSSASASALSSNRPSSFQRLATSSTSPSVSLAAETLDETHVDIAHQTPESGPIIAAWMGDDDDELEGQSEGAPSSLANRLGLGGAGTEEPEEQFAPPTLPSSSQSPPIPIEPTATPPLIPAAVPTSAPIQLHPQPRQFPPPGTLVVVQGVVHTTDVPRTPEPPGPFYTAPRASSSLAPLVPSRRAASASRPSTPSGSSARNRLSALMSHPSSILGRPSSRAGDELSTAPTPSTGTDLPGASDTLGAPGTFGANDNHASPATGGPQPTSESTTSNDTGTISPSSIDVLGTLLSVAAAATAASLLTGSSEPIFSSGLGPPPTAPEAQPNTSSEPNRPMSPTPTSGLGLSVAPLGAGIDGETPAQAGGRVRAAWGNLRERLGLRGSHAAAAHGPHGLGGIMGDRALRTPADPREHMLAEMARAFNLGLGLAGHNEGGASRESPSATTAAPERILPPEDSFERFLLDLQTDLRIALSAPSSTPQQQPSEPPLTRPQGPDGPAETGDSTTTATTTAPIDPGPSVQPAMQSSDDDAAQIPVHAQAGDPTMPLLESVSDSEDEEDAPAPTRQDGNESSEATHPLPRPPRSSSMPASLSARTERRPGGGINWWRMYRFPLITAPQPQGLSAVFGTGERAGGVGETPASSSSASGNAQATSAPSTSAGPGAESGPSVPPLVPTAVLTPNVVVPVILVGLQSVAASPRLHRDYPPPPPAPPPAAQEETVSAGPSVAASGADHDADGTADNASTTTTTTGTPPQHPQTHLPEGAEGYYGAGEPPRGRTWGSRAANALRNMRPGRRGADTGVPLGAIGGSRTFMIYVVGGYYPPDHHMATGSTNLDSFEALWELAELLGQVKPPTVTREDIEKSGLEIIKPAQLQQYEQEGKVASSCVDRCLICLDDYEESDDLRLMTCRHTFHKDCVDKWLQTGRNNCPACRSKGVSTDETPTTSLPSAASTSSPATTEIL